MCEGKLHDREDNKLTLTRCEGFCVTQKQTLSQPFCLSIHTTNQHQTIFQLTAYCVHMCLCVHMYLCIFARRHTRVCRSEIDLWSLTQFHCDWQAQISMI